MFGFSALLTTGRRCQLLDERTAAATVDSNGERWILGASRHRACSRSLVRVRSPLWTGGDRNRFTRAIATYSRGVRMFLFVDVVMEIYTEIVDVVMEIYTEIVDVVMEIYTEIVDVVMEIHTKIHTR
jgi:hypothetical protein